MVKGKSKNTVQKDDRIEWKDLIELKALCDLCVAQVLTSNRSGGYLRIEGYVEVIKQLMMINKVVSQVQIKNKWVHLRKVWKVWKQLFEHETRLGYDLDTGKIDATDEQWERKIKVRLLQKMLTTSIFYN